MLTVIAVRRVPVADEPRRIAPGGIRQHVEIMFSQQCPDGCRQPCPPLDRSLTVGVVIGGCLRLEVLEVAFELRMKLLRIDDLLERRVRRGLAE